MASPQQISELLSRAIELAQDPAASRAESVETLSEMMQEFDLSPSGDPVEMAQDLFNSPEMQEHLSDLESQGVPFPTLAEISDLPELRSSLLL